MSITAAGDPTGAIASASQAMAGSKVQLAAGIKMQKVSQDLTQMTAQFIQESVEKMAQMGATVSVLA
jgi:hypothetical protein